MLLPGLIDAHSHAGHGDPDRENFGAYSRACAAGGAGTACTWVVRRGGRPGLRRCRLAGTSEELPGAGIVVRSGGALAAAAAVCLILACGLSLTARFAEPAPAPSATGQT